MSRPSTPEQKGLVPKRTGKHSSHPYHPRNLHQTLLFDHHPRLVMGTILVFSLCVALLTTKGLLWLGFDSLLFRYLFAAGMGYLAFFCGVWAWIWLTPWSHHMRAQRRQREAELVDPGLDLPTGGADRVANSSEPFAAQGGDFGGGGATGTWDDSLIDASTAVDGVVDNVGVGDVLDVGGDEGGCLIVLVAVLAWIVAIFIFSATLAVIWNAPLILAEVVFEVILGSSLVRQSKDLREADWSKVLFKRTWKGFAVVLGLILIFCFSAARSAPEATTAMEVIRSWGK